MTSKGMAYQYRLARWTEYTKERAELEMSIRAYCAMKGFAENTYFYWQRRLRNAVCTQIETEDANLSVPGFAQVALAPASGAAGAENHAGQFQVQINSIHLSVDSSYPPEKLAALLRELSASC